MEPGKSNKQSWTQRLDELPVEGISILDKEAGWHKLHNRLQAAGEKRKKPVIAWWMAASFIVAVAALLFLVERKTGDDKASLVSGPNVHTITIPQKQKAQTLNGKGAGNAEVNGHLITDNTAEKNTGENKEANTDNDNPTTDVITSIDFTQPAVNPIDTPATILNAPAIATTPARKKLKVVHNNEIQGSAAIVPGPEKNTSTAAHSGFFPRFRKPGFEMADENVMTDTAKRIKPKKSILPFSSLISQKE